MLHHSGSADSQTLKHFVFSFVPTNQTSQSLRSIANACNFWLANMQIKNWKWWTRTNGIDVRRTSRHLGRAQHPHLTHQIWGVLREIFISTTLQFSFVPSTRRLAFNLLQPLYYSVLRVREQLVCKYLITCRGGLFFDIPRLRYYLPSTTAWQQFYLVSIKSSFVKRAANILSEF